MIFSKFFKAKWHHKDSAVRLSAVTELSPSNTEQLAILHELVEKDADDNVKKAALLKINDMAVFIKTNQNNSSTNIQSFALKQIEMRLIKQNSEVTLAIKQQILTEFNKIDFAEQWLLIESDLEITKALYQKAAKPTLLLNAFASKQDEHFQQFLLQDIQDLLLLEKLLKKAKLPVIISLITERIENIKTAQEKPLILSKKIQLMLSKLLALKEQTDYESVLAKRSALENEWDEYQTDINCLTEADRIVFIEKYQDISKQVDRAFIAKAEHYQQIQIAKQAAAEKQNLISLLNESLAKLSQQLVNNIFENNELDEAELENQFTSLEQQLISPHLTGLEKKQFNDEITKQKRKLKQLPAIAESVTEATHLISKMSQLNLPKTLIEFNEKHELYNDFKNEWKTIENKSFGALPDSIKSAYGEITKQWQQGLVPFFSEQKKLFEQARKNSFDLNRLLNQGKYNACFGVFKKFKANFLLLSNKQQQRLQREYDSLSEKISELADWEHYIATPRKQQLLNDITALIEIPLDNPNEQAKKVKEYRATWNSLGHADEDIDKELNDKFNEACEQAFAPCRLYYAEQEKIREQHAIQRQQIISQAKALIEILQGENTNWKNLDTNVNKINKVWREAGEVERNIYKALQKEFNDAMQPIKTAMHEYREANKVAKETLISKAEGCLLLDDVFNAVNDVKALQSAWKEIGYAGSQQDNKLWQRFKETNDQVFAKRNETQNEQKVNLMATQQAYEKLLDEQQAAFKEANSLEDVQQCLLASKALHSDIVNQKPVIKALAISAEKLIKQLELAIKTYQSKKYQQDWVNAFNLLESLPELGDNLLETADYKTLSNHWKKKIKELINNSDLVTRDQKTLDLEVLVGIDSPKELAKERLETQVKLMQHQMLSGGSIDQEKLFFEWLMLGKFTTSDLPLLARIKPAYCS